LLLAFGIAAVLGLFNFGSANLRAFVTPSNSMCPTICEGERFFVDFAAYSVNAPARGEVIAFDYPSEGKSSLFMKRVIGTGGDAASSDRNGTIFDKRQALVTSGGQVCLRQAWQGTGSHHRTGSFSVHHRAAGRAFSGWRQLGK
jgi:signal peptidase I